MDMLDYSTKRTQFRPASIEYLLPLNIAAFHFCRPRHALYFNALLFYLQAYIIYFPLTGIWERFWGWVESARVQQVNLE